MIKLELPAPPIQLTKELQIQKTEEFIDSGNSKAVWNLGWLKDAVFQMAFGKCCYSEILLGEESKYMEIEHFHYKNTYPNEVMQWGNLLPSSKKCNTTKGVHDTVKEPIVNPFLDDPKEFFTIKRSFYLVKNNNEIAKRTIKKLALNDISHFVIPRQRIEEELQNRLQEILHDFSTYKDIQIPIGRCKRLLAQGNRRKEYAALVSTTILCDSNYSAIEKLLVETENWDAEFESLKQELEFCALL